MLGAVLVLTLIAPPSHAAKQQMWISGFGVADFAGDCEGADPDAGVFSNIFTSDTGPDSGLNGCWYFDFGSLETAITGDEVIDPGTAGPRGTLHPLAGPRRRGHARPGTSRPPRLTSCPPSHLHPRRRVDGCDRQRDVPDEPYRATCPDLVATTVKAN